MKNFQADQFKQEVNQLQYDVALKELFGNDLILTYGIGSKIIGPRTNTPREQLMLRKFSMVPLWYLRFLVDAGPSRIVDIGCGANFFKPVLAKLYGIQVHGIDPVPDNKAADENNYFDSDFSKVHTDAYESVFSIDALHFVPLNELTTVIKEFYNIVAPGGRGFLALNSARMIELTEHEWLLRNFNSIDPDPLQIQEYVRSQLSTLDIDFLVIDLLIDKVRDEYMDGNIRMVFKK
jgi:hypothetical protein